MGVGNGGGVGDWWLVCITSGQVEGQGILISFFNNND